MIRSPAMRLSLLAALGVLGTAAPAFAGDDDLVLNRFGRIIEDGAPDRLMQGEGPYRELVTQELNRLAKFAAKLPA